MFLDVSLFSFSNYPFSTYEKFQKEVSARRGIMSVYTKVPSSQLTFTCSKSTIKTIEKGVKYVQS